jgi:hypothetical protein
MWKKMRGTPECTNRNAMKRYLTVFVGVAVLATLAGCAQQAGSGSSGMADRSASADQQLPQKTASPSNAEQGEPPGTHQGGTGPAKRSPGAGSNPGAVQNGESAGTESQRPNAGH